MPSAEPLPLYPDSVPRPLATLTDESGRQVDFVENELMVEFATQEELNAFLAKWSGSVLAIDRPKSAGIDANPTYLIRVETEGADLSQLSNHLSGLNTDGGSAITVSSTSAKQLLAIGAETAITGKPVGINYLSTSDGYQDEILSEALTSVNGRVMTDDAGTVIESWNPNPFRWVYMTRGGNFDIGVAAAWKVLDRIGAFNNKVKIAVIDGGFGGGLYAGSDFPFPLEFNKASFAALSPGAENENKCNNGSLCPWHGWNVVNASMGQVNNGIGAAGPAGPVARLIAIRRSADIFNNIQSITTALLSGANIINMSFSVELPALLSWSVIPFDLATRRARGAGKLLFASAGNQGENIDDEDCFIACWESGWRTPAENGGVICVGAMDAGRPNRRNNSNYGDEDLDIWGPGYVWVGEDYADYSTHIFNGTSAAAPFVAGVAALIWAANPSLSNDDVERILYETAHYGNNGQVSRWPNAYAAVLRALGGTPPEITISVQSVMEFGACNVNYRFSSVIKDPDHGPPKVTWYSDMLGVLGTGDLMIRTLPDGVHRIHATAVDGIGLTSKSNEIVLSIENSNKVPSPDIQIISVTNHQFFSANQTITLEAAGFDPNNTYGALVAKNVRWVSSRDGELGSGQRIFYTASRPGPNYIYAYYTGVCGGTADDVRLIQITSGVADAPPNMIITTPVSNNIVRYGQGCLNVAGFGYDEEDKDFATIDWWETDRSDLQWKVLSFEQKATICLNISPNEVPTIHKIRLRGTDRTGHVAYSAPLIVHILPEIR